MQVLILGSELGQVVRGKATHLRDEVNKEDLGFVASCKMTRNNDFQANERLMITEFQVWDLLDSLLLMQTSNARSSSYDLRSQ